MALVKAKCDKCGSIISVDDRQEKCACSNCGNMLTVNISILDYEIESGATGEIDESLVKDLFEEDNIIEKDSVTNSEYYVGTISISEEAASEIDNFLKTQNKVKAIKVIREQTGLSLSAAKQFADTHIIGDWKERQMIFNTNSSSSAKTSSGCYVATAVYGSYDCSEVWILRRYRDNVLAKTWLGRAFIKTYYKTSPTLVRCFGDTAWFNAICKPILDRFVERLNQQGISNLPYEDKSW